MKEKKVQDEKFHGAITQSVRSDFFINYVCLKFLIPVNNGKPEPYTSC